MTKLEDFTGTWELDASKNNYQTASAPKSGTYVITALDATTLHFDMTWVDAQGQAKTAEYTSVVDDQKHPYENPELAEAVQTSIEADGTMQSLTYKNNLVVARGIRELFNDGNSLFITQETLMPDDSVIINTSVYNRK